MLYEVITVLVLTAFADMVSVAIENSTLIRESIVKERMEHVITSYSIHYTKLYDTHSSPMISP